MLKKSSSFVLASLRSSTYDKEYASPLHSLRPCWMAFLNILRTILTRSVTSEDQAFAIVKTVFQQPDRCCALDSPPVSSYVYNGCCPNPTHLTPYGGSKRRTIMATVAEQIPLHEQVQSFVGAPRRMLR